MPAPTFTLKLLVILLFGLLSEQSTKGSKKQWQLESAVHARHLVLQYDILELE